jgi:hypothetical protein
MVLLAWASGCERGSGEEGGEVVEVATSMMVVVVSDELAGDAAICFVMHCHTNSR